MCHRFGTVQTLCGEGFQCAADSQHQHPTKHILVEEHAQQCKETSPVDVFHEIDCGRELEFGGWDGITFGDCVDPHHIQMIIIVEYIIVIDIVKIIVRIKE